MTNFVERHFRSLIFATWLITSLLFLFVARDSISAWKMGDPDDQLRLVQVRDWIAGQSWWDITQYRMNPPEGGPMHWSRLVDIPIAAMILLLRPFLGNALAEQWACALVPLLTYGCFLALFAATAARLFGKTAALLAAASVFTILPAIMQVLPMRIDHHGWQLVCFMAAARALFDAKRTKLSAAIIGIAMATWIEISIEGLPFAIVFMAVLGMRWLFPRFDSQGQLSENHQLSVALLALAVGTCLLYIVTEGFVFAANYCDGLSPFHIGSFAAVASVFGIAVLFARGRHLSLPVKLVIGAFASAAGLVVVLSAAPQCTQDAFAELDPLVREYWYGRVPEGLPLWDIPLQFAMQHFVGLFFGVIGMVWMAVCSPLQKPDKFALIILFIGSFAVGTLVSRTTVYALCLGTIMLSPMSIALLANAEKKPGLGARMGLRVLAVTLIVPVIVGQNISNWIEQTDEAANPKTAVNQRAFEQLARQCQKTEAARMLNQLPVSHLMAGLDTSPAVLQFTGHSVVATGHHRNQNAMADVIRTFTGTADVAKAVLQKRRIDFLITCDGSFELNQYEARSPDGFGAQIRRGKVPSWLVRQRDIGPFHVWRVDWDRI